MSGLQTVASDITKLIDPCIEMSDHEEEGTQPEHRMTPLLRMHAGKHDTNMIHGYIETYTGWLVMLQAVLPHS